MYQLIIKLHLLLIFASFASFLLRTWWAFTGSHWLQSDKAFKVHKVVIMLMLLSALGLSFMAGLYPFMDAWVTEKFILLIAYVAFAMLAFRPAITNKSRYIFASVASGLFVTIFLIAKMHTPVILG